MGDNEQQRLVALAFDNYLSKTDKLTKQERNQVVRIAQHYAKTNQHRHIMNHLFAALKRNLNKQSFTPTGKRFLLFVDELLQLAPKRSSFQGFTAPISDQLLDCYVHVFTFILQYQLFEAAIDWKIYRMLWAKNISDTTFDAMRYPLAQKTQVSPKLRNFDLNKGFTQEHLQRIKKRYNRKGFTPEEIKRYLEGNPERSNSEPRVDNKQRPRAPSQEAQQRGSHYEPPMTKVRPGMKDSSERRPRLGSSPYSSRRREVSQSRSSESFEPMGRYDPRGYNQSHPRHDQGHFIPPPPLHQPYPPYPYEQPHPYYHPHQPPFPKDKPFPDYAGPADLHLYRSVEPVHYRPHQQAPSRVQGYKVAPYISPPRSNRAPSKSPFSSPERSNCEPPGKVVSQKTSVPEKSGLALIRRMKELRQSHKECKQCGMLFLSRQNLNSHIQEHVVSAQNSILNKQYTTARQNSIASIPLEQKPRKLLQVEEWVRGGKGSSSEVEQQISIGREEANQYSFNCHFCQENLEVSWCQALQEWTLKAAVKVQDEHGTISYGHYQCYVQFKPEGSRS